MDETIFAVSSGAPPAAIAVVRISGSKAALALTTLTGGALPEPRRAVVRRLRNASGDILDEALVLWFPAPKSVTGEDCAELHCHGGRAVVATVCAALSAISGVREAIAGEFTRRAFVNGLIDLAQAEALGDLLAAETELQRMVAQAGVGGELSAEVTGWRDRVLSLSAAVEASLDFSDEDDVPALPAGFHAHRRALADDIACALARPRSERLREGVRVVLAGPPNAGKSSLFNALLQCDAAIVTSVPGTTRDVLERAVSWRGVPFILIDTAGLREATDDPIERMGIEKAQSEVSGADVVLWLGPEGEGPAGALEVEARIDDPGAARKRTPVFRVSSVTNAGIEDMMVGLAAHARSVLPKPGTSAINARQGSLLEEAHQAIVGDTADLLLQAEYLRCARSAFDRLLGNTATEDMLDHLFSRFCIGK